MRRNMINPRRMRKLAYLSYLLGVFFIVVSLALSAGVAPATANEASSISISPLQGPGNCGDWDAKVENGPPWTYTTPNGELIQKLTVKAGSQQTGEACYPFSFPPSTQQNDCYRVTGLGTTSVTATDIGGSSCREISHIEIYFMDATPTATTPPPTPT
ncbi:MAG: hypothetical protein PVG32_07885, partial [Anaerolineales bacterium]